MPANTNDPRVARWVTGKYWLFTREEQRAYAEKMARMTPADWAQFEEWEPPDPFPPAGALRPGHVFCLLAHIAAAVTTHKTCSSAGFVSVVMNC